MQAHRTGIVIKPDPKRVFFRPFAPGNEERAVKIVARVMSLTEAEVDGELEQILHVYNGRHLRLTSFFQQRFEENRKHLVTDQRLSRNRQHLIGAYFTQEYSLESAALFNPSLVWHPDQSGVNSGAKRFIISLRAIGEGHVSSIVFRAGLIDRNHKIVLDATSRYATSPATKPDSFFDKKLFTKKLLELGLSGPFVDRVLAPLEESFTFSELSESVHEVLRTEHLIGNHYDAEATGVLSLAESNYEVYFTEQEQLSERVIFPSTPAEVQGIEDARFVEFTDEDGSRKYYAIYTACDGKMVIPQLLETEDFLRFKISTLNGPAVQNKGMALFPRKINDLYAVISRQDNENLYVMFSDNINFWYTKKILVKPTFPWEYVQLGNCGSPIETEAGWLVLSHGVGPMRTYSLGAFLLDRDDPTRVIGRLRAPLLTPNENERAGYVPNVVYSCGGQIHRGKLVIPYAMADYASSFALVDVDELLGELQRNGG